MPRSRGFDDLAAATAARDVFWERGYTATSLAQLQAATGLSKSSLYETYGSKRALFARALENYLALVIDPLLAPVETAGSGRPEVASYFEAIATALRTAPERLARRGCLLLNTATDLNDLDDEATVLVRGYRDRVHHCLARIVPAAEADVLTGALIGVMLTSRLDPQLAADLATRLADQVRHGAG